MSGALVTAAFRLKDVWIGWHREVGWVFLDRRDGRNSSRAFTLRFARADTWEIFEDLREHWKQPLYTYWPTHLESLPQPDEAASALEVACLEFDARSAAIAARVEALSKPKGETPRPAGPEPRRDAKNVPDAARLPANEQIGHSRADEIANLRARLLERQQADRAGIRNLLVTRGVRSLVHFTRVENLETILRNGLVPRAGLGVRDFLRNDESRADGYREASCMSVSFPNYRMFFFYQCKEKSANWAVLSVTPDILEKVPCLFFPANAASSTSRLLLDLDRESLMGLAGLERMFADDGAELRAKLGLPGAFTTDPQAEVLVFDRIDPPCFQGVRLLRRDEGLIRRVQSITPDLEVTVGGPVFGPRSDWEHWKRPQRSAAAGRMTDDIPF